MSSETVNALQGFKAKFEKLMQEFTQGTNFTDKNLTDVRQTLNLLVEKVNHPQSQQNNEDLNRLKSFVETAIPHMIHILERTAPQMETNEKQNLRYAVLEFLQKKVYHTTYSNQLVEAMVDVMEKDNEKNSNPASKILNEVIKSCNQHQKQMPSPQGVTEKTLMRVFDFLDKRIEFIAQLGVKLQQSDYNLSIISTPRQQSELRPNNQSIQFIGMIPHIYVHMMAYTGTQSTPNQETPPNIRESLRRAISNMLKAMKDTPYQEILQRMPRCFSSDLFNAYQKLAQFLFIILRRDKELESSANLMKHVKEQLEYIKHDQVIAIVIKFLKNCPSDDLIQVRTDLVYRMRSFLSNKRDTAASITPQEQQEKIQEIMNNTLELIEDDYIYGKETRLAPMIKSNLQIYWLETIKVILTNYLPQSQPQRTDQQNQQTQMDKVLIDFLNNQVYMEKIFDTLLKILFDQQTCLTVHEKTLELIKIILEHFVKIDKFYFMDRQAVQAAQVFMETPVNQPQQNPNFTIDQLYRVNSLTLRYKLMNRLFDMVGRKLAQLRKMFIEARQYLEKYGRWGITKKKKEVQLTCMPCNVDDTPSEWQAKLNTYIQESDVCIEDNLLSLGEMQQCYVHSFEDEEELILNSSIILNYSHYQDYVKEVKTKIIDHLVEITQKLMNLTLQTNQGLLLQQQGHNNRTQQERNNFSMGSNLGLCSQNKKIFLSQVQTQYMSRLLKNGLLIFEELHDPKLHFDLLVDKRKNTPAQFMQLFAVFHEQTNFKDIFEPNSKLIVRLMVKFHTKCLEHHCIATVFLDPFIPNPPPQGANVQSNYDPARLNKNILEFLMTILLKELQMTPEAPSQYGYCRSSGLVKNVTQREQDEYISVIQKLVRLPIRLFPRIKDDAVFRPIIKQFVLFLVKKLHESYYPADYLGLLISFVKRIQTSEAPESLYKQFQTLCEKPVDRHRPSLQSIFHNQHYSNINIVVNMFELFKTGAVEIQDTISELIVHLPLSKSQLVTLARQYPIYAECLFRAIHYLSYNDASVVQRTLSSLDQIVQVLTAQELLTFFGPLLGQFMSKLIVMVKDTKLNENMSQSKQHYSVEPAYRAMKILAKIGALARNHNWEVEVENDHNSQVLNIEKQLQIYIEGLEAPLDINITEVVRCASDLLHHLLDNQLASYMFKLPSVEYSFQLLKSVVQKYIDGDDVLQDSIMMERCIRLVTCFANITHVVASLATTTMYRIKEESEKFTESMMKQVQNMLITKLDRIQLPRTEKPEELLNDLYNQISFEAKSIELARDPLLNYLRIVVKCFYRRILMTCDDSLASKDVHAYLYEFIWNKLILKGIIAEMQTQYPPTSLRNDFLFSIVIKFFENQLSRQINQEGMFERSVNPRRPKDQILQAFGGPNTQSDGLNMRTVCLEALISLQDKQYFRLPPQIKLSNLKEAHITLNQLPDIIKIRTTIIAKELVMVTLKNFFDYVSPEDSIYHQQYLTIRQTSINQLLIWVEQNLVTYKEEVCRLIIDILKLLRSKYADWTPIFYLNLKQGQVEDMSRFLVTVRDPFEYQIIKINMQQLKEILPDCFISRVILQMERALSDIDKTMQPQKVKLYAQAFTILEFVLSQLDQKCYLFNVLEEDTSQKFNGVLTSNTDFQFSSGIVAFMNVGFELLNINQEMYKDQAQLITQSDSDGRQNCQINHQHYLDDLEYGINIEDIDLDVRNYVGLIKYIFLFFKSVLTLPLVQSYSKYYQKKIEKGQQDQQKLLNIRFRIVKVLYEGLTRVETTIRKTAYKSIQELLRQEGGVAKELFQNDEKLKLVMKPVLTCLQQDTFTFVPSFVYSLKMILKLFTQVFHRTLSDRMQMHLSKIAKEPTLPQPNNIPHNNITINEWTSNTPESLQFQTACVHGILRLFQHLTASFHQHPQVVQQGQTGQAANNPANEVIKETIRIEKNYKKKVGRNRLQQVTRKPLSKFLNTVAAFVIDGFAQHWRANFESQISRIMAGYMQNGATQTQTMQGLNNYLKDKRSWFQIMTQMVKEDCSYPLRERLSRELSNFTNKIQQFDKTIKSFQQQIKKEMEKLIQSQPQQDIPQYLYTCHIQMQTLVELINELSLESIEFCYQLTKKNSTWLKNNTAFLEYFQQQIQETIKKLTTNTLLNHLKQPMFNKQMHHLHPFYHILQVPAYQQHQILDRLASLMVAFCMQNPNNEEGMVALLLILEHDRRGKVKKWIQHISMNGSIEVRRQLLTMWLISMQLGEPLKEDENKLSPHLDLQQMMGYQVIYPILLHGKSQPGMLDQIIDQNVVTLLIQKILEAGKDLEMLNKCLAEQRPIMSKIRNAEPQTYCAYNQYFTSIVVDLLQVSSFISTHTSHFEQARHNYDHKIKLLHFGYTMCRSNEKLVSYFGKLYMGKFFRVFRLAAQEQGVMFDKMLKIYHQVLKFQDENINSTDQEIVQLCRKIIQIIIPYLDQYNSSSTQQTHDHQNSGLQASATPTPTQIQTQLHPQSQGPCFAWVNCTLQIFRQEYLIHDSDNMQRLCRFWLMFINNHQTFQQHHMLFNNHIINSMQQIGCHNPQPQPQHPNQNNPSTLKRIALDIAFLSIEWKFKALKKNMELEPQQDQGTNDEKLSQEIHLNFFIKQALFAQPAEEKDLLKRSLYLLKKILIIYPSAIQKLNMASFKKSVENQTNLLFSEPQQPQQATLNAGYKFFLTVTQILNIVLEFEPPEQASLHLNSYLELLGPSQQPQPPVQQYTVQQQQQPVMQYVGGPQMGYRNPISQRPPGPAAQRPVAPAAPERGASIHQQMMCIDHPYLVFYIASVLKKLIRVAHTQPNTEVFYQHLLQMARETIEKNQILLQQSQILQQRRQPGPAPIFMRGPQPPTYQQQQTIMIPMNINQAVFTVKEMFDKDPSVVTPQMVPGLRDALKSQIEYLKKKEKHECFLGSLRQHPKVKYSAMEENYDIKSYLVDFMLEQEDYPFGVEKGKDMLYFPDDFPDGQKLKYHLYRTTVLKIMKMLAYKFNELAQEEQTEYVNQLRGIIEGVGDFELKMEAIVILRLLFVNFNEFADFLNFTNEVERLISRKRADELRRSWDGIKSTNIMPAMWVYSYTAQVLLSSRSISQMFDRKLDHRAGECCDNTGAKILEIKIMKIYFAFLCEFLMTKCRGYNCLRVLSDNAQPQSFTSIRQLLITFSKLPTSKKYLRFLYQSIFQLYGHNIWFTMIFEDCVVRAPNMEQEPIPSSLIPAETERQSQLEKETESTLLLGLKMMILGKGIIPQNRKDLIFQALRLITTEYLPMMIIYQSSQVPLQEQHPSPLKDLIISQAALALMGPAQNISSRLLKPTFVKLLHLMQPAKYGPLPSLTREYSLLVDYLSTQMMNSGVLDTIVMYLIEYARRPSQFPQNIAPTQMVAYRVMFEKLLNVMLNKGMFGTAQYLIEELQNILPLEHSQWLFDLDHHMLQIFYTQFDREQMRGIWYRNAGLPWVRQLIFESQLREPRRILETIYNNRFNEHEHANPEDEDIIQMNLDHQYVKQIYHDSLIKLNQWGTLKKKLEDPQQVNQFSLEDKINLKIDIGIRERNKSLIEQSWRDLLNRSIPSQVINNNIFLELEESTPLSRCTPQNIRDSVTQMQNIMQDTSTKIMYAQIIMMLEFSRIPPMDYLSYDQSLSNLIIPVNIYRQLHEKLSLYDELEEIVKAPQQSNQQNTNNPQDTCQENAMHIYQINLNTSQSYRERASWCQDDLNYHSQISHQRIFLQNLNYYRFQFFLSHIPSMGNLLPFSGSFFEPQLPILTQLRKQGLLNLVDDDQLIKDVPDCFKELFERHLNLERLRMTIKYDQDYMKALTQTNQLIQTFNEYLTKNNSPMVENRQRYLAMLHRFKVILTLNMIQQQETLTDEHLDSNIAKALEFTQNQYKLYRDIQKCNLEAHRKYQNNSLFAHNVINLAPLVIRYKPKKTNPEMIQVFYLLLLHHNQGFVTEAFLKIWDQLPAQVVMLYIPQIIYIIKQNHINDQLRQAVQKMLIKASEENKCYFYHLDPAVKGIINNTQMLKSQHRQKEQFSVPFYGKLCLMNQTLMFESIMAKCGEILDQFQQLSQVEDKYIAPQIQNLTNTLSQQQHIEWLKSYCSKPIEELLHDTNVELQRHNFQALYTCISQIYLTMLKCIFRQGFNVDIGDPRSPILTQELAKELYRKQHIKLPLENYYELIQSVGEVLLPNLNQYVKGVQNVLTFEFTDRKYFKRTINLISENEKKHSYYLQKQLPQEDIYLEKEISQQFIEFMNFMMVNHRETKRRYMEVNYDQIFFIYFKNEQVPQQSIVNSLTPLQGKMISLQDIHDQHLMEKNFEIQLKQPIPFFFPSLRQHIDIASQLVDKYTLQQRFLRQARTFETFQALRKQFNTSLTTFIAQTHVLNYVPSPNETMIDISRGKLYHNNAQLWTTSVSPYAIRFTRNLEKLSGETGINNYLQPGFAAIGLALSQPILNYPVYLQVIQMMKKTDGLQKKIYNMVFDDVDCSILQNYSTAPIKNKLPVLLEASKRLYSDFNPGIVMWRPWL